MTAPEPTRWLISYTYRPVWRLGSGQIDHGPPSPGLELIDEHPAVYLANARLRLTRLLEGEFSARTEDNRADEIVTLHCAIPVPDGTLTVEQAEAFE